MLWVYIVSVTLKLSLLFSLSLSLCVRKTHPTLTFLSLSLILFSSCLQNLLSMFAYDSLKKTKKNAADFWLVISLTIWRSTIGERFKYFWFGVNLALDSTHAFYLFYSTSFIFLHIHSLFKPPIINGPIVKNISLVCPSLSNKYL